MKRILTGFTVTLVAAIWMTGSWFFFNSIAVGAQGSTTASATDVSKADPKDEPGAAGHCGEHWKGHHGDWKGRHGHHHLWKMLDLTDAQKKEMFSIKLEEHAKMKPLFQELKAGREKLKALPKGQFDEAKVRTIAKEQANTIADMIVAKERMKSRLFAVLTPEQRTKFEQMREKCGAGHGKKPEHKD